MLFTFASESAEKTPHVSLPAEQVFSLFGFPVSNALAFGIIGYGLVIGVLFFVANRVKKDNKNRFVSLVQWIFELLYGTVEQVLGDKVLARKVAPLVITMFFFILIQYWLGILPVTGPLEWDGIPIFRSLAADLNTTFALAAITIVAVQYYAIKKHGFFGNLGRYFRNPLKDVAGAFEGILELVAEFSRFVGLSLRLFGNVFAGEILLMMIAFLTTYAAPVVLPPFYIFELFIGAVQAYIFFMLTVVFISLGVATHGHDSHEASDDETAHSLSETPHARAATSGN
jgi:F-type H+-transporting ATPase subunit a